MSTFAARMREAQLVKLDARNRGQSQGNHRGTVKARDDAVKFRDFDALEEAIFLIVDTAIAGPYHGLAAELEAYVREVNDATCKEEIPF